MASIASTSGQAPSAGDLPSAAFNPLVAMAQHAATANRPNVDSSRWVCIYPCYLNKTFSVADGRKIPLSLALDKPVLAPHIFDTVANKLKLPAVLQRKRHPRDWDDYGIGRVKVSLTDEHGAFIKDDIKTRKQLLRAVAELMKKHPMAVPQIPSVASITGQQQPKMKQGGVKSLPARKKK